MNIFKLWVVILAFVSSQLAWNLRPFVGSRDLPFELIRKREGNFYIAVFQSTAKLFEPARNSNQVIQEKSPLKQADTTLNKHK